jgi:hypothetical protein
MDNLSPFTSARLLSLDNKDGTISLLGRYKRQKSVTSFLPTSNPDISVEVITSIETDVTLTGVARASDGPVDSSTGFSISDKMVVIETTIKRKLRIGQGRPGLRGTNHRRYMLPRHHDRPNGQKRRPQQEDQKLSYHLQADEKQKDKNQRQGHEQKPQSKQPENKKQQQKKQQRPKLPQKTQQLDPCQQLGQQPRGQQSPKQQQGMQQSSSSKQVPKQPQQIGRKQPLEKQQLPKVQQLGPQEKRQHPKQQKAQQLSFSQQQLQQPPRQHVRKLPQEKPQLYSLQQLRQLQKIKQPKQQQQTQQLGQKPNGQKCPKQPSEKLQLGPKGQQLLQPQQEEKKQLPKKQQKQNQKQESKSPAQEPSPRVEQTSLSKEPLPKPSQSVRQTGKEEQKQLKKRKRSDQLMCQSVQKTAQDIDDKIKWCNNSADYSGVTNVVTSLPHQLPVKKERTRPRVDNSALLWEAILAPARKTHVEAAMSPAQGDLDSEFPMESGDVSVPMVVSLPGATAKSETLETPGSSECPKETKSDLHREETTDEYKEMMVTALIILVTALHAVIDLIIWLASPWILTI